MAKQIAINLTVEGVSPAIVRGVFKSGVANTLPLKPCNQHYTATMVIYEKNDCIKSTGGGIANRNNS